MIDIYHGTTSVCSIKVRIALAETGLAWNGILLDLARGAQFEPAFLKLNPEAVVPVLVSGDFVLRESSAIIDHVNRISPDRPLMPGDAQEQASIRLWLIRCIEIHAAINTLSFGSVFRDRERRAKTPEEIEAHLARLPNPQIAAKRRDLLEHGMRSVFVGGALHTLKVTFDDMVAALERGDWLVGSAYSLADVALIAYLDRLDQLGFAGLWQRDHPAVGDWLDRARARPSFEEATASYIPDALRETFRASGETAWPILKTRF